MRHGVCENMLVAAGPNGYDAEVAAVEGSLWQRLHLSAAARGEAHRAPDRRRVASHVLVSRRLRVARCAAEPEA
jgi:hypothetical protein